MDDPYCTVDDLKPFIGTATDAARADTAIESASRWIDSALGLTVPFVAPIPSRINLAAINVAVRFYRSPEAPFGVIGMGEAAMYVGRYLPDVEMLLRGYHESFGVA
jgi:hypothetical protein